MKPSREQFRQFNSQVQRAIIDYFAASPSLVQVSGLLQHLRITTRFRGSKRTLTRFLKDKLGLVYRSLGVVTFNHNKYQNKLQRQLAASKYIDMIYSGKTVINIDESVLASTDCRRRGWVRSRTKNFISQSQRLQQINMIAAVSNKGDFFFTLNQGRTNSLTFSLFLTKLIEKLTLANNNWRSDTVFLLDNAPYHRSKETIATITNLCIPTLFLGPYQFRMAPVESLFSFIKSRDLNPGNLRAYSKQVDQIFSFQPSGATLVSISMHLGQCQ